MPAAYGIFADEAWTHGGGEPRRYWCFYGGIFGLATDLDRLDTDLRKLKDASTIKGEVKWQNLSALNRQLYIDWIECLRAHILSGGVKFRQMFYDNAKVRIAEPGEPPASDLDVQFKLCYQFLKHHFGLKHLPLGSEVLIRLDTHSSEKHKRELREFVEDLPRVLDRPDLTVRITYHDSDHIPRIQICDLLVGAAGSHGNLMHKRRKQSQRGMTPIQKTRREVAKHIYNTLREIDAQDRGSMAFNWFESTGLGPDPANSLNHRVRIWKFLPRKYKLDKGWDRDNLDNQGRYIGPQIVDRPQWTPPTEPSSDEM